MTSNWNITFEYTYMHMQMSELLLKFFYKNKYMYVC